MKGPAMAGLRADRSTGHPLRRLLVAVLVLATISSCSSIQTPPPPTLEGRAGSEGDAGWDRVRRVAPGQVVFIDVLPPVESHAGVTMEPLSAFLPPPARPPYDVTTRVRAELVSVGERLIVIHPPNPLVIDRSRIARVSVYDPNAPQGSTGQAIRSGAFAGALLSLPVALAASWASDGDKKAVYIAAGASYGVGIISTLVWRPPRSRATLYSVFPPPPSEVQSLTVPPQALDGYGGSYAGEGGFRLTFSVRQGRLEVVNERRSEGIPLYAVARDEFVSGWRWADHSPRGGRLHFVFARDAAGSVTGVLVTENDREMAATRTR